MNYNAHIKFAQNDQKPSASQKAKINKPLERKCLTSLIPEPAINKYCPKPDVQNDSSNVGVDDVIINIVFDKI